MRVVIIANVILGGLPRKPGHVFESEDEDYCDQLVHRGIARAEPDAEPEVAPVQPAQPLAAATVEIDTPQLVVLSTEPEVVEAPKPVHETKAQRKAREKLEAAAKATESDHIEE